MGRKSKVVSFSLPPELVRRMEALSKQKHQSRSEFLRELLNVYEGTVTSGSSENREADLAQLIKSYWELKSQADLEVIVTGLGIVTNRQGKVLIGALKSPDLYVKNLTWSFPGGRLTSLDFARDVKQKIEERTGVNVEVKNLITSRVFPDNSLDNVQIITLYFHAVASGDSVKPTDPYKYLKWVKPMNVFKYFTSSTSDEVTKFLLTLQTAS